MGTLSQEDKFDSQHEKNDCCVDFFFFFLQFVLQSIESLMIRMGLRRERESQKE